MPAPKTSTCSCLLIRHVYLDISNSDYLEKLVIFFLQLSLLWCSLLQLITLLSLSFLYQKLKHLLFLPLSCATKSLAKFCLFLFLNYLSNQFPTLFLYCYYPINILPLASLNWHTKLILKLKPIMT